MLLLSLLSVEFCFYPETETELKRRLLEQSGQSLRSAAGLERVGVKCTPNRSGQLGVGVGGAAQVLLPHSWSLVAVRRVSAAVTVTLYFLSSVRV